MRYLVALLLVLAVAGCSGAARTAEEAPTPESGPETPPEQEPETEPEPEPEPETEPEPELEPEPEPETEPVGPGTTTQPAPVVDTITVSLVNPHPTDGQTPRANEGGRFFLALEFNGLQNVELPQGVEWPEAYHFDGFGRIIGEDFSDGYCLYDQSDSNGDSGKQLAMPVLTNLPLVFVSVRHDADEDTDRTVTVTLERCELYLLDDMGIPYVVSDDENTFTASVVTAGDVTGTVTTYSISMETTSAAVVEGEALPIQLRSDHPLPSCIEADDITGCEPNDPPVRVRYLAKDSETGRSHVGVAGGSVGDSVFVPNVRVVSVPDTEFESTDRTMQVEIVDLIDREYARRHSDGDYYFWVPPTEGYVVSGTSSVTVTVTDSP